MHAGAAANDDVSKSTRSEVSKAWDNPIYMCTAGKGGVTEVTSSTSEAHNQTYHEQIQQDQVCNQTYDQAHEQRLDQAHEQTYDLADNQEHDHEIPACHEQTQCDQVCNWAYEQTYDWATQNQESNQAHILTCHEQTQCDQVCNQAYTQTYDWATQNQEHVQPCHEQTQHDQVYNKAYEKVHVQTTDTDSTPAEQSLFDDPMYAAPDPRKFSVSQTSQTASPGNQYERVTKDKHGLGSSQHKGTQEYSCIDDSLTSKSKAAPLSHEYAQVSTQKKAPPSATNQLPPIAFKHYEMSSSVLAKEGADPSVHNEFGPD